jgi:hypothetical protein
MSKLVEMNSSAELTLVSAVLDLRKKARTAPPNVQEKIRGLQGLLDSTKPMTVDWRGGNSNAGSHGQNSYRSSGQHDRDFGEYRDRNPYNHDRGPEKRRFQSDDRFRRNQSGEFRQNRNDRDRDRERAPIHKSSSNQTFPSTSSADSPTPSASPLPTPRAPPMRYQSRFKNSSQDIEEKILNRIIRLKLNKFGQSTYNDIREFLFQILGDETDEKVSEFVKDFMSLVFSKAAAEEIYCPLYALLLSEIGQKHKIIFEEMNLLLKNYLEIFEDIDPSKTIEDGASFEKHNIEKKYRMGYSQFLAELMALKIVSIESLSLVFNTLIQLIDKHSRLEDKRLLVEEYVDCLKRMCKTLDPAPAAHFYKELNTKLDLFINLRDKTFPSLSSKSRFLLMDVLDLLRK